MVGDVNRQDLAWFQPVENRIPDDLSRAHRHVRQLCQFSIDAREGLVGSGMEEMDEGPIVGIESEASNVSYGRERHGESNDCNAGDRRARPCRRQSDFGIIRPRHSVLPSLRMNRGDELPFAGVRKGRAYPSRAQP